MQLINKENTHFLNNCYWCASKASRVNPFLTYNVLYRDLSGDVADLTTNDYASSL